MPIFLILITILTMIAYGLIFLQILCMLESFDCVFRHIKQQEEDIAICECKYDANDPDSACGEACLNVLTSTECTPGYCRCGLFCKNQVKLRSFSYIHICLCYTYIFY